MSPETRTLQRLAAATEAHARSQVVQRPPPHTWWLERWWQLPAAQSTVYRLQLYTDRTAVYSLYSSVHSDLSTDRTPSKRSAFLKDDKGQSPRYEQLCPHPQMAFYKSKALCWFVRADGLYVQFRRSRPPRSVSTGPVVVRLAEMAIVRERERAIPRAPWAERKCGCRARCRRAAPARCNDDNWSPADVLHPAPPLARRADEEDVSIDFSLKKKKVSASPLRSGCPIAHAAACCHGDCC